MVELLANTKLAKVIVLFAAIPVVAKVPPLKVKSPLRERLPEGLKRISPAAVSYTHLDVYKRQI